MSKCCRCGVSEIKAVPPEGAAETADRLTYSRRRLLLRPPFVLIHLLSLPHQPAFTRSLVRRRQEEMSTVVPPSGRRSSLQRCGGATPAVGPRAPPPPPPPCFCRRPLGGSLLQRRRRSPQQCLDRWTTFSTRDLPGDAAGQQPHRARTSCLCCSSVSWCLQRLSRTFVQHKSGCCTPKRQEDHVLLWDEDVDPEVFHTAQGLPLQTDTQGQSDNRTKRQADRLFSLTDCLV